MSQNNIALITRSLAYMMVSAVFLYLLNNYLVFWQELPGTYELFSHYGYFGLEQPSAPLEDSQITQGWTQFFTYLVVLLIAIGYSIKSGERSMQDDAIRFAQLAAYIIRFAFWSICLVGLVDMTISFLRVENLLESVVGESLTQQLGRPIFRGSYVHYPLIIFSLFMAYHFKKVSFSWLTLMVVLSEFLIVVTRFIFSYEQAYMGDVVRFWYAGLFLFASAHTLVEEGHVRVDVLYAGFSRRRKAWFDTIGCAFLGIPICWVILMQGMGGRGNSINSPLLSFEVSQSGYGMYVKYLMAAFLIVYSVSMLVQFVSYLLFNIAQLSNTKNIDDQPSYKELVNVEKVS